LLNPDQSLMDQQVTRSERPRPVIGGAHFPSSPMVLRRHASLAGARRCQSHQTTRFDTLCIDT
jgi:hypothetical protein